MTISNDPAQAREAARHSDGTFGEQHLPEPDGVLTQVVPQRYDDPDKQRVWAILCDQSNPENAERWAVCGEDADEHYGEFSGYDGGNFVWEVQEIAAVLREHYDEPDTGASPTFTANYTEGEGHYGADFGVWLPHIGLSLTRYRDLDEYTEDRSARGVDAAVAIAQTLDFDYVSVRNQATRLGLLPATGPGPIGARSSAPTNSE